MIEFSKHAKERVKKRNVTEDEVIEVITNPEEILFDKDTGNLVAIRKKNKYYLIVIYTPTTIRRIVSVIVTSKFNIVEKRIKRGRWVKV